MKCATLSGGPGEAKATRREWAPTKLQVAEPARNHTSTGSASSDVSLSIAGVRPPGQPGEGEFARAEGGRPGRHPRSRVGRRRCRRRATAELLAALGEGLVAVICVGAAGFEPATDG